MPTPFCYVVVFRHTEPSKGYRMIVNGTGLGVRLGPELEKGLTIKPDSSQ
jgi:hypothetical protein